MLSSQYKPRSLIWATAPLIELITWPTQCYPAWMTLDAVHRSSLPRPETRVSTSAAKYCHRLRYPHPQDIRNSPLQRTFDSLLPPWSTTQEGKFQLLDLSLTFNNVMVLLDLATSSVIESCCYNPSTIDLLLWSPNRFDRFSLGTRPFFTSQNSSLTLHN